MSTVEEITAAIEQLPADQAVRRVADRHYAMLRDDSRHPSLPL